MGETCGKNLKLKINTWWTVVKVCVDGEMEDAKDAFPGLQAIALHTVYLLLLYFYTQCTYNVDCIILTVVILLSESKEPMPATNTAI